MQVSDALHGCAGAPHLFALRLGGPIIQVTARQKMLDVRSGRPHRWVPKWSDLVAIDWQVMTIEQLRKVMGAARQEG